MKPTIEQAAVKECVADLRTGDVAKVIAFAGAGKTTTLKLCAETRKDRGVYLAFNREIAMEAKSKLAATKCNAMTMHSLAYNAMQGIMEKRVPINANTFKASGIADRFHVPTIRGWGEYRIAAAVARTIANFAASDDEDFLPQHADAALIEALGDPDFITSEEKAQVVQDTIDKLRDPLHLMAGEYFEKCVVDGHYNDDMYLKMLDLDDDIRAQAFMRYKYLMVDEAQDLNPVQRSIAVKTGLPLIAVGDPHQQIYSWRGAENALAQLPGRELYLTQSFRFGDNVAALARRILASIPDGGPEQRLIGAGPGKMDGVPRGACICRTNIGMLDEAVKYMNKGHKIHVDNIDGLLTDVLSAQALFNGEPHKVKSQDLKQFDTWEELETTAEEGGDPGLSKLVNLVKQKRIGDVEQLAEKQHADPKTAQVVVCTGHRSKGLEFGAVQLAGDWQDIDQMTARFKIAEKKSEKHITLARESFNVLYVAATRAMQRTAGYGRILDPNPEQVDAMTYEEAAAAMQRRTARDTTPEPSL